jgi:MFS family permease
MSDTDDTPRRRRLLRRVAARAPFADVPGPFPAVPRRDTSLDDQPTSAQERGMRAFWWDGFWASVPETVIVSYLGLYIVALGGSNGQVGLVTAFSSLFAALAFFPGAKFVETFGHRKLTVLVTGGLFGRAALLGLAVIPFVADGHAAIWLVLVCVAMRGLSHFALPGWTSLASDIIPIGMRGRFFASRNFGMSISALATAPIAGYLLDRYSGLDGWQIVWFIAFSAGVVSLAAYAAIPDPAPHADVIAKDGDAPQLGLLADIFSNRPFVMYLAGTAAWNTALHAGGPFFNIYLAENLGASSLWIGILTALASVTGLAGLVYFGRAMDARGTKWTMIVTGLIIPTLPAMWLVMTEPWHVLFINAYGGVVWAGYQLAALNMVMIMSPADRRPRYSAAFHAVVFAAAFVGPIVGGQIIEAVGFKALFVFSSVGRLAGTLIMLRFVGDPERRPD